MRITKTSRPTCATATLSRPVSALFTRGDDGPAIADETATYRRTIQAWLCAHPEIRQVEVYMSARHGGSQTDVIEA
jgi:hypothetical protein